MVFLVHTLKMGSNHGLFVFLVYFAKSMPHMFEIHDSYPGTLFARTGSIRYLRTSFKFLNAVHKAHLLKWCIDKSATRALQPTGWFLFLIQKDPCWHWVMSQLSRGQRNGQQSALHFPGSNKAIIMQMKARQVWRKGSGILRVAKVQFRGEVFLGLHKDGLTTVCSYISGRSKAKFFKRASQTFALVQAWHSNACLFKATPHPCLCPSY